MERHAEHDRFAERLARAMAASGMKQAGLVRAAAVRGEKLGKSQVSQYVSGKTLPRPRVMRLLAELLEVDEGWLATGEAPRSAHAVASFGADAPAPDAPVAASASAGLTAAARAAVRPETASRAAVSASGAPGSPASGDRPAATDPGASGARAAHPTPSTTQRSTPMRTFTKSTKLDNVLYDVRGPVADEAARMEDEGLRILKLNIGNPAPFGFRTPDEVVTDMRQQLPDCEGYSDSRGLFSARKAIMQYSQIKGLPNVSMDGIYTGNGVSELIQLCMNALLDTGDEILIPSPDYPLWTACATLAGGTPVHYVCDEEAEWNPDLADIESKITPATKAIVIINPNNPTGAVYPREVLEQIVEIARRHRSHDLLGRDLRPPVHGRRGAHLDRLARARPALRDVLGPLQEPHDRGLPHRLDGALGQQALHEGLHLRHQHALQHAPVLQRAGAVRRADGARRLPERGALR